MEDYAKLDRDFAYYFSRELLGVYGTSDFIFTSENKFTDTSGTEITSVPWSDYFKFVFLPQYNSINIRNYNSLVDYDDPSLPDISFKGLLGNGFVPLPSYNDGSDVNVMSTLAYGGDTTGKLNAFLPIYQGDSTSKPKAYEDEYETYVNTNDSAHYADKNDGQYGYYSPLGLKAQALVKAFFDSKTFVYYDSG